MRYYKKSDGDYVRERDVRMATEILGYDLSTITLHDFVVTCCKGIIGWVDNPTIEELCKHGQKHDAISKYWRENDCRLIEAKDAVEKMIAEDKWTC